MRLQIHRHPLPGRGHSRGQGQPQSYRGEEFQGLRQSRQVPGPGGVRGDQFPPCFRAAALHGLEVDRLQPPAPQGRGQARGDHGLAHVGVGAGDEDAFDFR